MDRVRQAAGTWLERAQAGHERGAVDVGEVGVDEDHAVAAFARERERRLAAERVVGAEVGGEPNA